MTGDVPEGAPAEEYVGPAVVADVDVDVRLRGHFEPLDGRFHWYGRVAPSEELAGQVRSGSTVTLTTPRGTAQARVSDVDPWGRFRISGTGRPPF
jgi:hypothetical protein